MNGYGCIIVNLFVLTLKIVNKHAALWMLKHPSRYVKVLHMSGWLGSVYQEGQVLSIRAVRFYVSGRLGFMYNGG